MTDENSWRVDGPVAGTPSLTLGRFDLAKHGYVVEEFFLSGRAHAHGEAADYRTRMLVCRPADAKRFGGTVVVEWLNVSGGGDGAPDWMFMHRQILRTGSTWVGVSAQRVGVEGGGRMGNAGGGMRQVNPERYASLAHPGDMFAFDIYTHAALALRNDQRVLGGATPRVVISVGESQSAMYLAGYITRVDALAQVYDAFLVHGRGARAADGRPRGEGSDAQPTSTDGDPIRTARVPTITVQSETDVIGLQGYRARCEDGPTTRFWEIAGAAHFDSWGLLVSQEDDGTVSAERLAELALTPSAAGFGTGQPMNSGPQQHYVLQAALAHLDRWARGGDPAPHAPYLELATDGEQPTIQRDEHGIALGGLRTPWVDVPTATLSGLGAQGEGFAFLFGITDAFDAQKLATLYPGGRDEYLERFTKSAAEARAAGYLLDDDIDEIAAIARASWPA